MPTGTGSFGNLLNMTGGTGGLPSLNLPSFNQISQINPNQVSADPQGVFSLLAQAQPQSLANSIGPLLSSVFGTQANLLQPLFQQQTNQGVAQAQSNAMQRGLTGSTIEQAGLQAAQTQGNQSFDQYLASQLNNLVPAYTSALGTDISNQTNYLNNIAGAAGQVYSQNLQQQEFNQQLHDLLRQANISSNTQTFSGLAGIGGSLGAAAILSDIRLKEDIKPIGKWKGFNVYSFKYKKNNLGLPEDKQIGLMAHEVLDKNPEAVGMKNGYLTIDYSKLEKINA